MPRRPGRAGPSRAIGHGFKSRPPYLEISPHQGFLSRLKGARFDAQHAYPTLLVENRSRGTSWAEGPRAGSARLGCTRAPACRVMSSARPRCWARAPRRISVVAAYRSRRRDVRPHDTADIRAGWTQARSRATPTGTLGSSVQFGCGVSRWGQRGTPGQEAGDGHWYWSRADSSPCRHERRVVDRATAHGPGQHDRSPRTGGARSSWNRRLASKRSAYPLTDARCLLAYVSRSAIATWSSPWSLPSGASQRSTHCATRQRSFGTFESMSPE